jgi:ankyrin repeat protein
VAAVKTLVEAGADIEASAYDGFRPLHVAALHGHVEVVTTLVELGADIVARIYSGETPLQLSIQQGHHQVARGLRELERAAHQKGGCGQEAHAAGQSRRSAWRRW